MFHRWGFLLSEMWLLLILAALVGLLAGWIIWGRRKVVVQDTSGADKLRAELAACTSKGSDLSAHLAAAQRDLAAAEARAKEAETRAISAEARARSAADGAKASATVAAAAATATAPAPLAALSMPARSDSAAAAAKPAAAEKPAPAAMIATPAPAAQPKGLKAARGGKADDLKLISGVGPKLEALCNKLGFFHFDQIAAWTAAEIAWVDENLEGFKGRVTRDEWVDQAKDLAAGQPSRLKNQK